MASMVRVAALRRIYTNRLKPISTVIWSGIMNFIGALACGITVACALVEILPPNVLMPPDRALALPMLVSSFNAALFWNILTWFFGIPNSSSHCIIGVLIGVAIGDSFIHSCNLLQSVE